MCHVFYSQPYLGPVGSLAYQALKSIRETGTTPRRNKQGRKAGLSDEQEKELVEWVRRKTKEGNCPYVTEVWEELSCFEASPSWWRRFRGRHPTVTTRVVEKVSLARLAAEDPAKMKSWLEDWAKSSRW